MTTPPKTLLLFLGGAALLAGAYLTLQNLKETLETQLADRLTQAVGHISHDNLDVRLGGIHALGRLAAVSERDYGPIMHILVTYVRERASIKKGQALKDPPPRLAPDIQAALDVLGRRRHGYQEGERQRLDLRGTDLRRANLAGAQFAGAILSEVHLEEADLSGITLDGAILRDAHVERANLTDAKMERTFLLNTRLAGTRLRNANLREAHLLGARLDDADLLGADLTGAFGLTWDQIKTARKDNKTRLPDDLKLKAQRSSPGSP